MQSHDYKKIFLEVRVSNEKAINFYENLVLVKMPLGIITIQTIQKMLC